MEFVNREKELEYLRQAYKRPDADLLVLYGRRRVGKTRLIKEFIQEKPHIYFLCDRTLEIELQRRMQSAIGLSLRDPLLEGMEFRDWEALFRYWLDRADFSQKIILIIDEFQYLARANPAFPSILQRLWDEHLKSYNLFLILCGSLIRMMYTSTLSYESPLYGRRTGQMRLEPLSFLDVRTFLPHLCFQELMAFYSVTGGVPRYIEILDPEKDIFENIERFILDKNQYLYAEPRFILNEEVTETATYFSILRVIAEGEHKIGKIASRLRLSPPNLTRYFEVLIDLGILQRQVPITEEQPQKSKKGLYFIRDPFFRFWFRYVFPFQSQLEIENREYVLGKIRTDFSYLQASTFESIAGDLLAEWNKQDLPPFSPEKWGRWWSRNQEIDLVALNTPSKEILFGEC